MLTRSMAGLRRLIESYDSRFWVLCVAQFTVAIGFGAAMPFVSIYLHNQLDVPMTFVGLMMLVSAFVAAGARLAGGELSDRIGRRPVMVAGMASRVIVFAVMTVVIHLRCSALVVAGVFLLVRLVGAMIQPAISAMVADIVVAERRVKAYGLFRIAGNAGWAFGPAIGGALVARSYASLFVLTSVASLVGFVLVAISIRESIRNVEREKFSLVRVLDVAKDRQFVVFCAWSVLLFVVMGQFASTLAVFSTNVIGIAESKLGLLFTVNGIVVVLFQGPAAWLAHRIGTRNGLVLGCLLYAVGYLSVGFVPGFGLLLGSMVIITLGEVVFSPTSMTAVANMAPEARIGRYMGFFGLTEALGWSLGPFLGGVLFDRLPGAPVALWGIIAAIGLLAAAGFALTQKRQAVPASG